MYIPSDFLASRATQHVKGLRRAADQARVVRTARAVRLSTHRTTRVRVRATGLAAALLAAAAATSLGIVAANADQGHPDPANTTIHRDQVQPARQVPVHHNKLSWPTTIVHP